MRELKKNERKEGGGEGGHELYLVASARLAMCYLELTRDVRCQVHVVDASSPSQRRDLEQKIGKRYWPPTLRNKKHETSFSLQLVPGTRFLASDFEVHTLALRDPRDRHRALGCAMHGTYTEDGARECTAPTQYITRRY